MSRRDFLKSLSLVTIASALGFGGGKILSSKDKSYIQLTNVNDNSIYEFDAFSGCKNSGFKFSSPLPFDFKLIDELAEINKKYTKTKLTTLYGAMPANINKLKKLVYSRGINPNVNSFEDFAKYVKYAKNKGFNFVYLLNSPKPFLEEEFKEMESDFDNLLSFLKDIGCYNIKVGNQQLLDIFRDKKEFNIQGSTTFEFTNIRQLANLFEVYPKIKKFNLSTETNRNINLLKNIKKVFKNIDFEIMVDEAFCIFGCPARIPHLATCDFVYDCDLVRDKKNPFRNYFRSNAIYPWYLDYYANMGYKSFKLVGYIYGARPTTSAVTYVWDYFEAIENGVGNIPSNRLYRMLGFPTSYEDDSVTKEMISKFPDLNYFIKYGDKCANVCGASCNYCYDCADRYKKDIIDKQ